MKIRSFDATIKEVLRKYNNDPNGWYILDGKSDFPETVIYNQCTGEFWLLKRDTQFSPNFEGFGGKVDDVEDVGKKINLPSPFTFGLREVSIEELKTLMTTICPKAIKEIYQRETIPYPEARDVEGNFINGPALHLGGIPSSNPLPIISRGQRELDRKLSESLRKLMEKDVMY